MRLHGVTVYQDIVRTLHPLLSAMQGCFRHLRTMFRELEEIRPFEILKSSGDRVNYLMTKQAKIVAMTCTHAALKRRQVCKVVVA